MVSRSRAQSDSPDPLALEGPSIDASGSKKRALTKSQSWTPRKRIVVEIESPKKRRPVHDGTPEQSTNVQRSNKRTPLSRASPSTNRGTPTPRSKPATKLKAETPRMETVSPKALKTPRTASKTTTLASSVKKALPTPSKITGTPLRVTDDNPFLEASGSAVSRETFLANEALRRQKEARNFEYEGEADAPTLTRSGRVVGGATRRADVDEYGGESEEDEEPQDDVQPEEELRILPQEMEVGAISDGNIAGLSAEARPRVLRILSTLTGKNIASNPPAFFDEDTNEALAGLVNLLRATVERGEGNSALVVGPRGVGKTRTMARALNLVPSSSKTSPIVVRLSGHAQTNDRRAIREIGRQIAEAEGIKVADEEVDTEDDQEYAPTTLPSHLLALLTAPSPRAIIVVLEEFDMFTEHARQALLYCLLDVVQSVKTGDVKTTGRGVAVIGITSRVDTLLLLEKRVKSRFSHRMWRIPSPLSPGGPGWKTLLTRALVPWEWESDSGSDSKALRVWKDDWQYGIETLMEHPKVVKYLDRLTSLTTDVRVLYKPFIPLITSVLSSKLDLIPVSVLCASVLGQIEQAGWGLQNAKLKGLPQPALGVLIISKHLHYAGRDEFNFAQVEEEYLRFSRTKLVGSGRTRWPVGVLRNGYDHLLCLGVLAPASSGNAQRRFAKVRCTLSPHEVVAWFRGDGAGGLGPELVSWGRMMGGHA